MNISYNWLSEYLDFDLSPDELSVVLTAIGLEVGGIERVESIKGGLRGVVAGKVLSCVKHPNADRLSLCSVEVGEEAPLQIVCGAPNVAEGQTVWVATVGTVLYPNGGEEPLEIRKAKVRGETSAGMICAEDELGLGTDHDGIMILSDDVTTGKPAAEYYSVEEDHVIDIDLTPNRSDAISHLGVARDLAAYFSVQKGERVDVRVPKSSLPDVVPTEQPLIVEVKEHDGCPRYAGILLEGIQVKPSPDWLKNRLSAIGLRPINNIVDITNFVLHEMGQPLHAFDADRIGGGGIVVQTLPDGTAFTTLDEVERKLTGNDLMICDANDNGMCIAGVYGGIGTGVTEATTRVFLESAHFNPEWIRKTSEYHGLKTDAARAFEKTTDPNICVDVLKRAASLMCDLAEASVASEIVDIYPVKTEPAQVKVRWNAVRKLIGVDLDHEHIKNILNALHIGILNEGEDGILVAVPTDKADVTREADVIEEILRIHGFDNVLLKGRMEISLNPEEMPTRYAFRNMLGNTLATMGFDEMMAMSLTDTATLQASNLKLADGQEILIDNTSNVGLNLMRPDLLVSALEAVAYNNNRNQRDISLFEFGHGYQMNGDQIVEREYLGLVLQGFEHTPGWTNPKEQPSDYFTLKKHVEAILDRIGLTGYDIEEVSNERLGYGLRYTLGGNEIVHFGDVNGSTLEQFSIKGPVFFAQFDFESVYQAYKRSTVEMQPISRYPAVKRDLAFILDEQVQYQTLVDCVVRKGGRSLVNVRLFDIYRSVEQIGPGKKSYAIELTFEDPTKTLTDSEVDTVINRVVKTVGKELEGSLRD